MKQNPVTSFIGLLDYWIIGLLVVLVVLLLPSRVLAVSCSLSDNATNTLNSACVIDGTTFVESGVTSFNGITNGDMVVSGADVTVAPGTTMTWSPGKAIIIENGGRIIRGANAVLKQIDPQAWFRQQLGFDTYAAGAPVKILGQNLQICTADPCTVTAPAGGGSLVVENSIKFGDGTTMSTVPGGSPAGFVGFFNLASCPTGWTELTGARGRVIVGLPASGTLAGTVGTALTDLLDRTHTHSFTPAGTNSAPAFTGSGGTTAGGGVDHTHTGPSHTHNQNMSGSASGTGNNYNIAATSSFGSQVLAAAGGTGAYIIQTGVQASGAGSTSGASAYSHTHTFTPAGSVAAPTFSGTGGTTGTAATSNTMPYIQLLVCQKS